MVINMDLRVKKTQRALGLAMMALLEEQPFGKITVNDICTEAMVSRSAFYANFEDKHALLRFCIEYLAGQLLDRQDARGPRDRMRAMLERVNANMRLFKNLMMSGRDYELTDTLHKAFHADFVRALAAQGPEALARLPGPPEIISVFYASGVTSAIAHWVGGRLPYSLDEMADCLCALVPDIALAG